MVSFFQVWTKVNLWVNNIPNQAIDSAYQSALNIKQIEDQYFQGNMISPETQGGESVFKYHQSALNRELAKIRLSLTQLDLSNFFELGKSSPTTTDNSSSQTSLETEINEKLIFIESIISKYRQRKEDDLIILAESPKRNSLPERLSLNYPEIFNKKNNSVLDNLEHKLRKKDSLKRGRYSEEYEQKLIEELQQLRRKKKIAIRILALLIIVPFLVQIVSKNLIYVPVLDFFKVNRVPIEQVKISEEIRAESLEEYRTFRDILEIRQFLDPESYSEADKEEKIKEKIKELSREAAYKAQLGLANILADITALLSFVAIIYFRRRQCRIAVNYINENFLSLNVVTQVFLLILITDVFVGFHSAEGWDVILSKTFEHVGIPENPVFNGLFIATIPVMLDSIFKLLIFNYFTRKSPTAVAVLEKMNQ